MGRLIPDLMRIVFQPIYLTLHNYLNDHYEVVRTGQLNDEELMVDVQ